MRDWAHFPWDMRGIEGLAEKMSGISGLRTSWDQDLLWNLEIYTQKVKCAGLRVLDPPEPPPPLDLLTII